MIPQIRRVRNKLKQWFCKHIYLDGYFATNKHPSLAGDWGMLLDSKIIKLCGLCGKVKHP